MDARELMQYVPPKLRYERVPLADEENALGPWREAIAALQPWELKGENLSKYWGGCMEGEEPPSLSADDWAQIAAWNESNAATIDLVDQGIARGRLQFPVYHAQDRMHDVAELRHLSRAIRTRSETAEHAGNLAAACADAIRLLWMSDLMLQGEGNIVHLLVGSAIRGGAVSLMSQLARGRNLGTPERQAMIASLSCAASIEDATHSAERIDLSESGMHYLARFPASDDSEVLVDAMLANLYDDGSIWLTVDEDSDGPPLAPEALASRLALRRAMLLQLLADHPRLFDRAATAELMVEIVSARLKCETIDGANAALSWRTLLAERLRRRFRPTIDERTDQAWPFLLRPSCQLDFFGHDPLAAEQREDLIRMCETIDAREFDMPSSRTIGRGRRKLRRIDNPVGRMIAASLVSFGIPMWLLERDRARIEEARRALAG